MLPLPESAAPLDSPDQGHVVGADGGVGGGGAGVDLWGKGRQQGGYTVSNKAVVVS